jgi:hypothetical protein
MGASYTAVGWNRQKKNYDWLIAAFCFGYLAIFISITLLVNEQATFETLLLRSSSTLAVLLLHVILAMDRFAGLIPNSFHCYIIAVIWVLPCLPLRLFTDALPSFSFMR